MTQSKRTDVDWNEVLSEWFADGNLTAETLAARFSVSEKSLRPRLREWERVIRYLGRLVEPLRSRAKFQQGGTGILSDIERLVNLTNAYLEGLSDPESGFSLADASSRLLLLRKVIDKIVQSIAELPRDEAAALISEELERIATKHQDSVEEYHNG